jgi:hypothetical protein
VSVSRQVLAEPTPDLAERTWANLGDGTPLVTGARRDQGTVVLFHVTPEATWSNLPISGSFVEMLRRIVQLSRNQGSIAANAEASGATLPPYSMIAANGQLIPPTPDARPIAAGGGAKPVTIENPPGLYGSEDGLLAHNLLKQDAVFAPIVRPQFSAPVTDMRYALNESRDLRGPLLIAALVLMVLDTLAVFWMGGQFARRPRRTAPAATAAMIALAFIAGFGLLSAPAFAQDQKPGDAEAIDAIATTRLAYVVTGDSSVDAISRAGLTGLTRFLIEKTALEPGEPAGVDLTKDELSFYPIIYWPIDPNAQMPSEAAIARVDAYMKQGGTVLFDTRDQYATTLDASASPATQRLRDILDNMNVPPLEPVPEDHVLTKAFFILRDFPGRFSGSPLWVEASVDASNDGTRPVRTGDGVTPDHDHRQRPRRGLGDRRKRRAHAADGARRSDAACLCLSQRHQHRDVHADRQLQVRPSARSGAAREAGAVEAMTQFALYVAPLCPAGHLPHKGGRSAGRLAFANRQRCRRRAAEEARDLPPCGGDVRQDRGGQRRATVQKD